VIRCLHGHLRSGFTLIELLGVIIVFGLIATVAMVSWEAVLPRTQLNSAVRQLAGVLQETRSNAIARNAEFEIVYDLVNHRYWVKTPFRPGGGLAAYDEQRVLTHETSLPDTIQFGRVIVDGREFREELIGVRFDALGTASDHVVTLVQNHVEYADTYTIEVMALTGLIRFHEGEFVRPFPDPSDFD
jgi:prepilin-type N-terminal cleavage/methylation domain-containing protein